MKSLSKQEPALDTQLTMDPEARCRLRDDSSTTTYEIRFIRSEYVTDWGCWMNCQPTIAYVGTLEDALMRCALHIQNETPYFESILAMQEAQKYLPKPIGFKIYCGDEELVLESVISQSIEDADDQKPDPSSQKMIRYENTWSRRSSAAEIPKLEQKIQEYKAEEAELLRHKYSPTDRIPRLIEAAEKQIALCNFHIPNQVLEKMIFDTDLRLGSLHHLTRYFSEDLGL